MKSLSPFEYRSLGYRSFADEAVAFLRAAAVATVVFGLQVIAMLALEAFPPAGPIWGSALVIAFVVTWFGVSGILFGALPFAIIIVGARRFGIRSVFYYAGAGLVIAAAITLVTRWMFPGADESGAETPYWVSCERAFSTTAPAVVCATLSYWWLEIRGAAGCSSPPTKAPDPV